MAKRKAIDPIRDLKTLVDEVSRAEALHADEAFILWFIRSHLIEDPTSSRNCLTRRGNEKGVDAIFIDHVARQANIIQGKYRTKGIGKAEPRQDVMQLAGYGRLLAEDEDNLASLAETIDVTVREKLKEARRLVRRKEYGLNLYFLTTGTISRAVIRDAQDWAGRRKHINLIPIHGKQIQKIIADYISDAAPGIPSVELIVQGEILGRHDDENNIDSYVFTMNGKDIGDLVKKYKRRIFARNIRGFLGRSSEVNRSIEETLKDEPENFWYFNNGVTIICDEAKESGTAGRKRLQIKNPQIINGQQTSNMLSLFGRTEAELLVKVISIPREEPDDFHEFNDLVSEIVAATNWQSKILPSDLKANDPEQIRIERELRKQNVLYVRKRMAKGEARAAATIKPRYIIRKDELAQAVAAVELDPVHVRSGKETLFEADLYSKIFPSERDLTEYLAAYFLNVVCRYESQGDYVKARGRWLAANYLWTTLRNSLGRRGFRQKFIFASERYWQHTRELNPLYAATRNVLRAVRSFYFTNRKTKDGYLDEASFFSYRRRHTQFQDFIDGRGNRWRRKIRRYLEQFTERVEALEI